MFEKKNVYLLPDSVKSNQYYENLTRCISDSGYNVFSVSQFMAQKHSEKSRNQIFVLSWQEDSVVKPDLYLSTKQFVYLIWVLVRIWFYRGSLVWIKHNFKPHKLASSTFLSKYYYLIIRNFLSKMANLKLAHSKAFCENNHTFTYIPHPHYKTGCFNNTRTIDFLMFGKIMRYKHIPQLLSSWPKELRLSICGVAEDRELTEEIEEEILKNGLEVEFDNRFIDDITLNDKLSKTKIVICPNSEDSMIVSGVIIHALSAGCAVLARQSDFATELKQQGLPVWVFENEAEIPNLSICISRKTNVKPTLNYTDLYADKILSNKIEELFKGL